MAKDRFPDLEAALQGTHRYDARAFQRVAGSANPCKEIQGNIAIANYEHEYISSIVKSAIATHVGGCGDCRKEHALLAQLDEAISFYQDNELSAAQSRAMMLHLNACDGCGTSHKLYVKATDVAREMFGIPPKRNV